MAAAAPATVYPQSHVGFDSITQQIERKLLKRGFQFNVICVGTSHTMVSPQVYHLSTRHSSRAQMVQLIRAVS